MNRKGQTFLIGSLIIVGIVLSVTFISNKVESSNIFSNEEKLVNEFETEIREVIDYAVINNLNVNSLIDDYLSITLARGQEKGIDWKIAVNYNGMDFTRNSNPLMETSSNGKILFRLVSERDGEVFVKENI